MDDPRPVDGLGPFIGRNPALRNLGRAENDLEDAGGDGRSAYRRQERRARERTGEEAPHRPQDLSDRPPSELEEALVAKLVTGEAHLVPHAANERKQRYAASRSEPDPQDGGPDASGPADDGPEASAGAGDYDDGTGRYLVDDA